MKRIAVNREMRAKDWMDFIVGIHFCDIEMNGKSDLFILFPIACEKKSCLRLYIDIDTFGLSNN